MPRSGCWPNKPLWNKRGRESLVSVCERALLKFEKSLPSTDIAAFRVTPNVIESPEHALQQLLVSRGTGAFVEQFRGTYGIALAFDNEALGELADKAANEHRTVDEVCQALFDDYGHGLKLLGHASFEITAEAVRQPKAFLNGLVKAFYQADRAQK